MVSSVPQEVADVAGVTEVTVRNRYKGLRSDLGKILGLDSEPRIATS
jgi:transcription initiation factor TFIIIB Brf1 subunit/transcription initiation factor TFIIB